MTFFKLPEFTNRFGALDDDAIQDSYPLTAHVVREMSRNGNYLQSRGGLALRWLARNTTVTEQGRALQYAPAHWQHMVNVPAFPVRKPYRINQLRVRLRAIIQNGQAVQFFVGTSLTPNPIPVRQSDITTATGTGAMQVIDFNLVNVRESADELLSFYCRALINPSTDPLMNTGTYGTPNTGTVSSQVNGPGSFRVTGAAWNTTGNTPSNGGHYARFYNAAGNITRYLGELVGCSGADILYIDPPCPDLRMLIGSTFDIRKLPSFQPISLSCYWVTRTN